MELALSLGNRGVESNTTSTNNPTFCMGLKLKGPSNPSQISPILSSREQQQQQKQQQQQREEDQDQEEDHEEDAMMNRRKEKMMGCSSSSSSPTHHHHHHHRLQLDLLPFSPVPRPNTTTTTPPVPALRFPWLTDNLSSEPGSSDVNRVPVAAEETEEQSSPNSGTSSFMEFSLYTNNSNGGKGCGENGINGSKYGQEVMMVVGGCDQGERGATTSRGSDDDENGSTRKKLRLSKEQSAFLEESFKEHHTLNPKQKLALAKQLNLRPRQVEVWFQNRRARTKLKQTEVDCEYLKRCCETLTEENRRLQKELQELRALKTSQPFFMQLPATTLTMCPSCERVAPTSSGPATTSAPAVTVAAPGPGPGPSPVGAGLSLGGGSGKASSNKTVLPFSNGQAHKGAS